VTHFVSPGDNSIRYSSGSVKVTCGSCKTICGLFGGDTAAAKAAVHRGSNSVVDFMFAKYSGQSYVELGGCCREMAVLTRQSGDNASCPNSARRVSSYIMRSHVSFLQGSFSIFTHNLNKKFGYITLTVFALLLRLV
jgi:hypothetical protein